MTADVKNLDIQNPDPEGPLVEIVELRFYFGRAELEKLGEYRAAVRDCLIDSSSAVQLCRRGTRDNSSSATNAGGGSLNNRLSSNRR